MPSISSFLPDTSISANKLFRMPRVLVQFERVETFTAFGKTYLPWN